MSTATNGCKQAELLQEAISADERRKEALMEEWDRWACRFALWRIDGNSATDSGGGDTTILALTADCTASPNPCEAIKAVYPIADWYEIHEIKRICCAADLQSAIGATMDSDFGVANLTGYAMGPEITRKIAWLVGIRDS